MLAVVGGAALAFGFIWLLVEWMLRYAAGHGVKIVGWAGPWPQNGGQQRDINDRLDRSQERELRRLRTLRPIPILVAAVGIVLIIIAAV